MADVISLAQRVSSVDVSPQFQPYSKVIIHIDDDNAVEVGDNTGRTLEFDNPFGSEAMARSILNRLSGYQYQPYQADGALLDPAAEIGDAVGTATSYGGLYTRSRKFGRLMKADISAPHDEEINHEYKYESPQERKFTRVTGEIKASIIITNNLIQSEVAERKAQGEELTSRLTQTSNAITAEVSRATAEEGRLSASISVQASEIAAKVSASGGGGSFSWVLNSSSHTWKANNVEVMRVSASGLWIKGAIEAQSGKIGGFDIGANALSYNGLTWGDTSKNYGAYIGQSGIQLGKNFKVDNGGNVSATNMTLSGTLTIGGQTITADALRTGAQQAYSNYGSWNGTTSTVNSNGGYWSGGAAGGYSYSAAAVANSGNYPSGFTCGTLYAKNGISSSGAVNASSVGCQTFRIGGYNAYWRSTTIQGVTLYYLGR
jgi:hypothetical protein